MIITRTPFRMSFGGGGSDLPAFYEKYGGCVFCTSINKYMYIAVHPYFDPKKTVLKYSKTEIVNELHEIEHTIFNHVLNELRLEGIEITCTADIPAGTGLGSSSTFTVGLLHTLYCYMGKYVSKPDLAAKACEVEIEKLGNPIGKQDQYAAALGGLNFIKFHTDGKVVHEPVLASPATKEELERNLRLYYLGSTREANAILKEQSQNMENAGKVKNLMKMCEIAESMRNAVQVGDLDSFGKLLGRNWELKRGLAAGITSNHIDKLYDKAINAGAIGGKLLGAGGSGFLLFYCPKQKHAVLDSMLGLRQTPFKFDYGGTAVIYIGEKYWDAR